MARGRLHGLGVSVVMLGVKLWQPAKVKIAGCCGGMRNKRKRIGSMQNSGGPIENSPHMLGWTRLLEMAASITACKEQYRHGNMGG